MKIFAQRVPAVVASLLGLVVTLQATQAEAGCGCSACARQSYGGANCGVSYQLVERTIYVPTMVPERRIVNVTECRTETRERMVHVSRSVPETRQVRDVHTVMVPETRTRVENFTVRKPVWRDVEQTVTVQVPHQEVRKASRQVCRQVQVQAMRNVTRDVGNWEESVCDSDHGYSTSYDTGYSGCGHCGVRRRARCGGCGACSAVCRGGCGQTMVGYGDKGGYDAGCAPIATQHVHRVWRPQIVTEQVPVTVWRSQVTEEPYEYTVTVYRPEQRQQKRRICEYVNEPQSREVKYTVCVPQQRESVRNVTTYRTVVEQHMQPYTVSVPYTVQKEVEVMVCRSVPKQVTCRVPVMIGGCDSMGGYSAACGICGGGGCRRCCR